MLAEFTDRLAGWSSFDTWIVVTAALAAMACALPGNYLVLRRQSMMGDALSHMALPGIVIAFLFTHWLKTSGWISADTYAATKFAAMYSGALLIGILSAVLTEGLQKLGRVESSAALGVVFTTFFAVGLLLVRLAADSVHIDPDCVLFGTIESTAGPETAVTNGVALAINLLLVTLFFKELRIAAFDPALATTLGIHAGAMHYGLMAVTAATLVAAFESVGSILVIAMLVIPPATARLLSDRLATTIVLSLIIAAASAVLGHVSALTLPPIIFSRLGFPEVKSTNMAGMMAVSAGMLFIAAAILGPRYGLLSKLIVRSRLRWRIACEDVLSALFRLQEAPLQDVKELATKRAGLRTGTARLLAHVAIKRLSQRALIEQHAENLSLSEAGRAEAIRLVRSHRLWESYMARHFAVPEDHLHDMAERVEHYLDPALRSELEAELDRPDRDPHGQVIPSEDDTPADRVPRSPRGPSAET